MTDISHLSDVDPDETKEWLAALASIIEAEGADRAKYIMGQLQDKAQSLGLISSYSQMNTSYMNSIPTEQQANYPGDIEVEKKLESAIRWNAAVMVAKANKADGSLGGHISTAAADMTMYEVGFNHCWNAPNDKDSGDLVFFQGHSSPSIYARAYLEGRLSNEEANNFRRQAVGENGLASYPHPWLHRNFWQFPTVSMGLGPLMAIYQARFMKYLDNRGIANTKGRKVWAYCGDGEMDEPESLGALTRASREGLDNLIFVISCNLQRLDGLVNGNGKIIQELAAVYGGAGWNVIKVLWGDRWEKLFAKDKNGLLAKRFEEMNDGEFQNCRSHGGKYIRETVFGGHPELRAMVEDMTDDELWKLNRGGHDPRKVYAAYNKAMNTDNGKPTVILMHTVKGYGLGETAEGKNIAHNVKKLSVDALTYLRNRFKLPISDEDVENYRFYMPHENSPEMKYLHDQRKKLGGYLPRRIENTQKLTIPSYQDFGKALLGESGDRELSTTTAFVRVLVALTKNKEIGKYVVPIVPDESRTFGMEGLFRQLGIYNHEGQKYVPEDKEQVMYYKESKDGQILQEGINEAGAFSSWIAAATAYTTHRTHMIPFYIYYSMFGFQRVGDLAWAAGDLMARGFLLGGTAGRTTLNGEGLQHQDGHSHIQAGLIPNCVSYDPTYAYEVAVIIHDGLRRMYVEHENVFYYLTLMNENYPHHGMPEGSEEGILKGMYKLVNHEKPNGKQHVQLMGSGTILREVEAAAELLEDDFGVTADVWSVTSANELYRDGMTTKRWNLLHPGETEKEAYITQQLKGADGPVVISTDYIKLYSEQLREFVPNRFVSLGTDGYGRSDTRENLRTFFEVNRYYVAYAALKALADDGIIPVKTVKEAMKKYNIDPNKPEPTTV